jgi:hypothetical protein
LGRQSAKTTTRLSARPGISSYATLPLHIHSSWALLDSYFNLSKKSYVSSTVHPDLKHSKTAAGIRDRDLALSAIVYTRSKKPTPIPLLSHHPS